MEDLGACVIPAAGQSTRMQKDINKQYLKLAGIAVLAHTWRVFARLSFIKEVILVVNESERDLCYREVVSPFRDEIEADFNLKFAPGGRSRQESVYNGICEVSEDISYVLIHDGARPLVNENTILTAYDNAFLHLAAIAAVPVKNTLKFVDEDGFVEKTPSRDRLWEVHTPQVFRKDILIKAHEKALEDGYLGFDDSSLVERIGILPRVVKSSYDNIKITTEEDIKIAERILQEGKI